MSAGAIRVDLRGELERRLQRAWASTPDAELGAAAAEYEVFEDGGSELEVELRHVAKLIRAELERRATERKLRPELA